MLGLECRGGRVAPFLPRKLGQNDTSPGTLEMGSIRRTINRPIVNVPPATS
jgi:hypothetical protein